MVQLILIRHAKSDWGAGVSDRDRPLNSRGRKQAPETGEWLADQFDGVDIAVVSVAARAQETWALIAQHLSAGRVIDDEDAYTFDGAALADVVTRLPAGAETAVVVGHNPAMEELIHLATGLGVEMPTSSFAVLELGGWGDAAAGGGRVLVAGRPADDRWAAP